MEILNIYINAVSKRAREVTRQNVNIGPISDERMKIFPLCLCNSRSPIVEILDHLL